MLQKFRSIFFGPLFFMLIFTIFSHFAVTTAVAKEMGHSLEVTVDISPELKGRTNPDQFVFIFAKAVKGPRAPLAAVKALVRNLPMTIRLDDSRALTPMFRLSNFNNVKISARVSQNGQAIKRSGDLEGVSPDVELGEDTRPVTVIIDHIVP